MSLSGQGLKSPPTAPFSEEEFVGHPDRFLARQVAAYRGTSVVWAVEFGGTNPARASVDRFVPVAFDALDKAVLSWLAGDDSEIERRELASALSGTIISIKAGDLRAEWSVTGVTIASPKFGNLHLLAKRPDGVQEPPLLPIVNLSK
mgnify:CR=1 FL=1